MQLLMQIVHWHTWWYHYLQFVLVFFLSATDANAALALGQIVLCNVALQR